MIIFPVFFFTLMIIIENICRTVEKKYEYKHFKETAKELREENIELRRQVIELTHLITVTEDNKEDFLDLIK